MLFCHFHSLPPGDFSCSVESPSLAGRPKEGTPGRVRTRKGTISGRSRRIGEVVKVKRVVIVKCLDCNPSPAVQAHLFVLNAPLHPIHPLSGDHRHLCTFYDFPRTLLCARPVVDQELRIFQLQPLWPTMKFKFWLILLSSVSSQ